jgi:hypothetical protein
MSIMKKDPVCAHCGGPLSRWRVPEDTSWQEEFFLVCFNDDCSYYREGWEWMKDQYNQHVSYRYAINPETGASLLIPVWSDSATREQIVEADDES